MSQLDALPAGVVADRGGELVAELGIWPEPAVHVVGEPPQVGVVGRRR